MGFLIYFIHFKDSLKALDPFFLRSLCLHVFQNCLLISHFGSKLIFFRDTLLIYICQCTKPQTHCWQHFPKLKVHFNNWTLHTQWQGSLCKFNFAWQVWQDYNCGNYFNGHRFVGSRQKVNLEEIFVEFSGDKKILLWSTVTSVCSFPFEFSSSTLWNLLHGN